MIRTLKMFFYILDTSTMTTQAILQVKVNSGAYISTVVVSVAASVVIFTLVLIIFILMIYISRLRKTRSLRFLIECT